MALPTASDNVFPKLILSEGAAPAAAAASQVKLYAKADGLLYSKDDAGVETLVSSGVAAGVATDALWDAAGDLAVGSGANTAAKLVIGAAGGFVSRINGVVAWNSGTSNPGAAAAGDRFWRTDLTTEIFYDGTRWLSIDKIRVGSNLHIFSTANVSATTSPYERWGVPYLDGGSDLWLERVTVDFFIGGGATALGASHNWALVYKAGRDNTLNTLDTQTTITINSGSSAVDRQSTVAVGALLNNGTAHDFLQLDVTKTGTPGTLEAYSEWIFRRVIT